MIEFLQFVITGIVNGSIYALIGLGFVLIYRSTKVVNFAQGVFPVLAGISVAVGSRMGFWGGAVGFVVGVAVASLAGILVGWAVTWDRLSGGLNPLVATVAISLVIEGALLALVGGAPLSYSPVGGDLSWNVGGIAVTPQAVLIVATLILVTLGLEASFRYTEVGKALIAATDSPLAAALLGMPLRRLAVVASGLSGFIGAIAGVLVTPILTVSFNSDVLLAVNGFIAAAIGGLESPLGAVAGGIFIGVVEGLVAGYSSPSIQLAVALGLMILALVARAWVQEDVG